jgi:hypothetical protein
MNNGMNVLALALPTAGRQAETRRREDVLFEAV